MASTSLFGSLTPEEFLQEYWQKKPLLVRGALPGFTSPISPDELAGLALDEGISSRLILEAGGDYPWQLRFGPFEEDDFASLPETHWTLLVQEVDRHVPAVAGLLDHFRFIPNWRLDDVMISYAPAHGGVGAHIDNYDVFLIQGYGRRRWQINHEPVEHETLVPDLDVAMLADFEPDAEWVLEPGDMLYLPPRIAHYGVAVDDCMTYSVGFRAPGQAELLEAFLTHALADVDPNARYGDPELRPPAAPGEISAGERTRIRALLRALIVDDAAIDRWFGAWITEPKRGMYELPAEEPVTPDDLAEAIRGGARIDRGTPTRLAFIRHDDGAATLFVSGETFRLDPDLAFAAPLLTGTEPLDAATLAPHLADRSFRELLAELVDSGFFRLEER